MATWSDGSDGDTLSPTATSTAEAGHAGRPSHRRRRPSLPAWMRPTEFGAPSEGLGRTGEDWRQTVTLRIELMSSREAKLATAVSVSGGWTAWMRRALRQQHTGAGLLALARPPATTPQLQVLLSALALGVAVAQAIVKANVSASWLEQQARPAYFWVSLGLAAAMVALELAALSGFATRVWQARRARRRWSFRRGRLASGIFAFGALQLTSNALWLASSAYIVSAPCSLIDEQVRRKGLWDLDSDTSDTWALERWGVWRVEPLLLHSRPSHSLPGHGAGRAAVDLPERGAAADVGGRAPGGGVPRVAPAAGAGQAAAGAVERLAGSCATVLPGPMVAPCVWRMLFVQSAWCCWPPARAKQRA